MSREIFRETYNCSIGDCLLKCTEKNAKEDLERRIQEQDFIIKENVLWIMWMDFFLKQKYVSKFFGKLF